MGSPAQVEEEPGRGHLPEERPEDAGGAGDEVASLGALGLAWGKRGGFSVCPTPSLSELQQPRSHWQGQ